ncbi:tyrosine-type recombinase/integrase [Psychroflexus aestuariivivens]|uniref:tyrosine-type recombinase/integrase n=1 Tax=Psychroflexus aestuariivivens TaxID=1795040 RepID=UPI000FDA413B|nr:site-specific integrase [Psychroflexus aestuariivivens]
MAIKVTLREKPISKDRLSLYLDFYPAIINNKGKETRREFLKMHIFKKPKNAKEKSHNKSTLQVAEKIKESRSLSIYNEEYGFKKNVELNINFVDYYKELIDLKYGENSKSNYQSWLAGFNYYKDYAKIIYTKALSKKHIEGFKNYLLRVKSLKTKQKLSSATVATYFKNLLSVINTAYEDDILISDLTKGIKNVKSRSKIRAYLTEDDLTKLWKTPIKDNSVKYICFFCAYTGFRFVEARKIKWKDFTKDNSGNYVINSFHTKGEKYTSNPISKDAYEILKKQSPDRKKGEIFNISYHKAFRMLKKWKKDAEINKEIGMHTFRHTYAVLQLEGGTDLFTLSKMLGHKNISTTMIYAKLTDNMKNNTLDKIKLNTNENDR